MQQKIAGAPAGEGAADPAGSDRKRKYVEKV